MNKKNILIEQTLHGYSQGHHLLASSIELSDNSLRIMSTLSDLSGPEVYKNFSEYITGYPLKADKYYALGKTWYASEMKRPGCVWTHTLLIRFEDLEKICDCGKLLNLFVRPQQNFNKDIYINPIELAYCNHTIRNDEMVTIFGSINELKYLLWTIYGSYYPVILPSNASNEYLKKVCCLWMNQSSNIRKGFTFCTGSLANRKLNKQTFDLQVVPLEISKSIGRSDEEAIIINTGEIDSTWNYPKWVTLISDELLYMDGKFKEFMEDYSASFTGKEYISKFAKLYIDIDAKNHILGIDRFLIAAKNIFQVDDYKIIANNIIDQLIYPNKWFQYNDMSLYLQELSTSSYLEDVHYNESIISANLDLLWSNDQHLAKCLLKLLLSKNLNHYGETLLKDFSKLIKPKQLPELTDMDLGACNVLVRLNPEFALSTEIWQQSKDYQCEIIDCIDAKNIRYDLAVKIIEVILENSNEILCEQVYRTFDKISISTFLNWCTKKSNRENQKKNAWMKICSYSPEECIKWLLAVKAIDDVYLFVSIVSTLDPYLETVYQFGIRTWLEIFDKLDLNEIDKCSKLILAQFFFPLILLSNETITREFVEFSFYPIHDELAKHQFDYDQWQKLDTLLPRLSWYNSWDKCKRLRKAMKLKGYLFLQ